MGTCGTPNRLLTTLHVLPLAVRTCPAAIKQRDSLGRKVAEIRILWTVAIRTLGPNLPWTGDSLPAPRPAATFALGASAGALIGARGAASARPGGILAACGTYVIARCWHRACGCPRLTAPRGPGPLGPHPSPRGRGSWSLGRCEGRQRASAPVQRAAASDALLCRRPAATHQRADALPTGWLRAVAGNGIAAPGVARASRPTGSCGKTRP